MDKLTLQFIMRNADAQSLMDKFSYETTINSQISNKKTGCHYNYYVDLECGNSFWIGFEANWKKKETGICFGRVEFNPAKVADSLIFQSIFGYVLRSCGSGMLTPVRFDLAIDMPVPRDKVCLIKDKRMYSEYRNSASDRTQYLGPRNAHGFVKLYNKALELKLDGIDLTRLELTIDYGNRSFDEVQRLIPTMYILDSYQFPLGISGTEKVIVTAILNDISLLNELGRKMGKKIKAYLSDMLMGLVLDVNKYNHVLDYIDTFKS